MDLLIVGNGFSIDLRNTYKKALKDWNTSKPLSWELYYPENTKEPLLDSLPLFELAIDKAKTYLKNPSDFDLINNAAEQANIPNSARNELSKSEAYKKDLLRTEIYIFLSYAYSSYDKIASTIDSSDWRWQKFLAHNRKNILAAISFNYDLVFERILQKIGLNFFSFGIIEEKKGILLGKPHGSIDYEINPRDIYIEKITIPTTHAIFKNDTSLVRLTNDNLLKPRVQCELVPPLEASTIREFQWVDPVFKYIKKLPKQISRCIIIGFSYGDADKQEMNEILDSLVIDTEVIVASPNPNEELIAKIKSKSLRYSGSLDQIF